MGIWIAQRRTQLIRKLPKKRKTVVAPRKKSKKVKSSKQTLSEIASGLKTLPDSSCPPDSTRR